MFFFEQRGPLAAKFSIHDPEPTQILLPSHSFLFGFAQLAVFASTCPTIAWGSEFLKNFTSCHTTWLLYPGSKAGTIIILPLQGSWGFQRGELGTLSQVGVRPKVLTVRPCKISAVKAHSNWKLTRKTPACCISESHLSFTFYKYPLSFSDNRDAVTNYPFYPLWHCQVFVKPLNEFQLLPPFTPPLKVHAYQLQETEPLKFHRAAATSLTPWQVRIPKEYPCSMVL